MGSTTVAMPTDVMRVLAHELRQPLSTIESIAYYLTLILPEDEKVREQLDRIQSLVEQSNWMLTSGQLICDALPSARGTIDLQDLIGRLDLTGFDVEIDSDIAFLVGDAALWRAVLENLVMFFRQFPGRTVFRATRTSVELSCAVIGYRTETSLGPGSGLSIQGVRRMVEASGGSFDLSVDPATGIGVRVMLP